MRRLAVVSAIAVLAGTWSFGAAEAAVLSIPLTGSCAGLPFAPCANVRLAGGATRITLGSIDLDDSSYSPFGFFENEVLVSFSFAFGDFSLSKHDVPLPLFSGSWGGTPGTIEGLSLHAYASDDREHPGPLISLGINDRFGGFSARPTTGSASRSGVGVSMRILGTRRNSI